jgi:hypothetical protein
MQVIPGEYGSYRHPLFLISPSFWSNTFRSMWDGLLSAWEARDGMVPKNKTSVYRGGRCNLWWNKCLTFLHCNRGLVSIPSEKQQLASAGSNDSGNSSNIDGELRQNLFSAKELGRIREIPRSAIGMLASQSAAGATSSHRNDRNQGSGNASGSAPGESLHFCSFMVTY